MELIVLIENIISKMLRLFKYLYKVFGPSEIEKIYKIINKL